MALPYSERNMTASSKPPTDMSIVSRIGDENGKALNFVRQRIARLADILCGGVPRPAHDGESPSSGSGVVDRLFDHFTAERSVLEDINNEVDRIERKLGTFGENSVGVGMTDDPRSARSLGG